MLQWTGITDFYRIDLFQIVISLADYSSMEVRIVTCKHEWGNVILGYMRRRVGADFFFFSAKSTFKLNNFMIL